MQNQISYKKATFYFYVLFLAGLYNLVWGAWVILFPKLSFTLHGMELPRYLEIWQCVGMIVGVYGIGYIAASSDPIKHWPIVLVGFLGKIFGPIGFAKALIDGVFPPTFFINIIFNDLIWWVPFFMILKDTYKANQNNNSDIDLKELKLDPKSVIVALRHQGCTFSRENLELLNTNYKLLKEKDMSVYILHMSQDEEIKPLIEKYIKDPVKLIADPDAKVYKTLKLNRVSLLKAFGITEFVKGARGFFKGYGLGPLRGDGFQLGGIFLIENDKVTKSYPTERASDTFKFEEIINS